MDDMFSKQSESHMQRYFSFHLLTGYMEWCFIMGSLLNWRMHYRVNKLGTVSRLSAETGCHYLAISFFKKHFHFHFILWQSSDNCHYDYSNSQRLALLRQSKPRILVKLSENDNLSVLTTFMKRCPGLFGYCDSWTINCADSFTSNAIAKYGIISHHPLHQRPIPDLSLQIQIQIHVYLFPTETKENTMILV